MKYKGILIVIAVLALLALSGGIYTVDETEQVVVTQFGKVVGNPVTEAGLNFKIPFIQHANFFPKNLLEWDGEQGQIPTLDKTFIWVDTFSRWKIVDPLLFFQTVTNVTGALSRLDDIIDAAVRNLITSNALIETVRSSNRKLDTFEVGLEDIKDTRGLGEVKVGRKQIAQAVMEQAQPKLAEFGIDLVDVKIKRINYVDEVQRSVFGRMIAERQQIAEKFRSEGRGEARKIEGDKERELKRIDSEAYRKAQELMGKADAEATKIYGDAYGLSPDFYSFMKTLGIYQETLDRDTSLVLSTDSEFFKYLKGYKGYRGEKR
jgi:modulator of FtsH protease HflC